jgi:hypothetical protein
LRRALRSSGIGTADRGELAKLPDLIRKVVLVRH